MIPLTDQLEQARRQQGLAQARFDNLYGTYDQPGSELAKANRVLEVQKAIVSTLKTLVESEAKISESLREKE